MAVDLQRIEELVRARFNLAKVNLYKVAKSFALNESAISDTIPGYSARTLNFGSYDEDRFAVLFVDMRRSTSRAEKMGPKKTFLSMHAFIPALLAVVEDYDGYVIDIMGDGLMVFFGGKSSGITNAKASQNAGLCGLDMIKVVDGVVNKILVENDILDKIAIGVGCDFGDVIVTKIGTDGTYDTKAYGNCINKASKFADEAGAGFVKVSKEINNYWPTSKGGKIGFTKQGEGFLITHIPTMANGC